VRLYENIIVYRFVYNAKSIFDFGVDYFSFLFIQISGDEVFRK